MTLTTHFFGQDSGVFFLYFVRTTTNNIISRRLGAQHRASGIEM